MPYGDRGNYGDPDQSNLLQNLGIALSLMGGGAQGKPLEMVRLFSLLQGARQKQQAAQQQATLRGTLGGMVQGDLRPGQLGPPQPFDFNRAMGLALQDPDMAKILSSPQFIEQMRIGGRMPTTAGLFTQQARDIESGLGPSPGLRETKIGPEGPTVTDSPIKSGAEHRALGVSESGVTGSQRIQAAKEADVKLPDITEITKALSDIQTNRTKIADLQFGGPKPNAIIEAMGKAMSENSSKSKDGKAALESLMGETKDPQKTITLMLKDFVESQRAQVLENKLASPPYENRKRIIIAPEYEVFKAQAEKSAEKHVNAWRDAHNGEDPTVDDLRLLFIADLLETSGASKWITPTPQQ